MGDPIARVQNPFPKNIVEFVKNLPKIEMSKSDFKEYMKNCKWGEETFFKTYYQLCCQVGLYFIDENEVYHPRFKKDISEEEAKAYLLNWFSKYYIPNPYTKGFIGLQNPILVEFSMYEYLKKTNENSIEKVCLELFKEPIGNPDIFINAINTYSKLIKVENKHCFIKEEAEKMEVTNSRDDKRAFFENFNDNNSSNTKIDKPHNRIIFGAPGTGKSHKLENESSLFVDTTTTEIDDNEFMKQEIYALGSDRSNSFAIGIKYFDKLKDKKIRDLQTEYNCNRHSAYAIYQAIRVCEKIGQLPDFGDEISDEKVKQELDELLKIKYMNQAGAAAIGFKYSDHLDGRTISELKEDFSFGEGGSLAHWMYYGVQAANYQFDKFEAKSIKKIERVTFHPNYSYAQFVGTYKPVMQASGNENMDDNVKRIIKVLTDMNKTGQEKYDLLFENYANKTDLIALVGLATGEDINAKNKEGISQDGDHTGVLRVGKALRAYADLKEISKSNEITYSYIPGPFMRVYVNAKRNPEKNFLLLIEEINRANVAAVFGDVFQLLDRKSDGTSQYPIAASEDQKNYLESCGIYETEISIPSNMYIWATMNSADQGVQPMDAAFKRRWDFEYIGIDDNEESVKDYVLPIPQKNSDGNIFYTSENWNKIRKDINNKLKNIYGVNEDKLLGPYFLSKSTLDEAKQINFESETDKAEKICSLFKSKVLMYLYEDVVKMNPTELFSKSEFESDKPIHYSDLCNKFDEVGLKIFGEEFIKE